VRPAESTSENMESAAERWRPEARRCTTKPASTLGQWSLLAFVQLYRVFLSPFFGGACKFYPSCSKYAQEAIARHGAKHGSALALKRLWRCRPFTKGGFDPVPDSTPGCEGLGHARTEAELAGGRSAGLVAASRDRHDYSDAEWLRSVNKELVQ
jgi:uncharacterized protein